MNKYKIWMPNRGQTFANAVDIEAAYGADAARAFAKLYWKETGAHGSQVHTFRVCYVGGTEGRDPGFTWDYLIEIEVTPRFEAISAMQLGLTDIETGELQLFSVKP